MDSLTSTKRSRPISDEDESALSGPSPANSPDLKRLKRVSAEDYILNILDEEDSAESQAIDGLASVMHSLEEELRSGAGSKSDESTGTGTGTVPDQEPAGSAKELGYLLEASDDELGLPPAAEESPAITGDVVDLGDGCDVAKLYGQMWGFDDEIGFGSDFGFKPEMGDEGFGVIEFDDVGLFDHSEPSDLTWRPMPAV
ncbi:hypothetical protein LUZ60_009893 [Juncus effusus]|nr:hypothetical protein LUZ60_009893 [Juncus effusus]